LRRHADGLRQGWYLGRTGELNCSRVCAEEQRFLGKQTKPAGMYCHNEHTPQRGRIENITEIVRQIRWRDWQGASSEQNPVQCDEIHEGHDVLNFAPSVRYIGTMQQCKPGWFWAWHGTPVSSACDPDPASWTTANGFSQTAEDSWLRQASTYLGPSSVVRRLCKCLATPPTTTTTTTTTTLPPLLCPASWTTRGNGAMCNDAAGRQSWRNVELRRFRPRSLDVCKSECTARTDCQGFVYWAGQEWSGGCRLYNVCSDVSASGSSEFSGSVVCEKQR